MWATETMTENIPQKKKKKERACVREKGISKASPLSKIKNPATRSKYFLFKKKRVLGFLVFDIAFFSF